MSIMECKEFNSVAEQVLEGELLPQAQAHLSTCGDCRALIADLRTVAAAGRDLGAAAAEPSERVWLALRAQLESEGVVRDSAVICWEFREQAAGWLDGGLDEHAQSHLAACAACSAFLTDLKAIAAAGPLLEAATPAPPERIWISLRAQLEAEGLIREREAAADSPRTWAEVFAGFAGMLRRPALAAVYAAALILAVMILPGHERTDQPDFGGLANSFGAVELKLRDVVPALEQRNPVVAATYRDNLAIVDNFIAVCEKTVRANPGDSIARDYLAQAYQQKAELLSTLAERGVGD